MTSNPEFQGYLGLGTLVSSGYWVLGIGCCVLGTVLSIENKKARNGQLVSYWLGTYWRLTGLSLASHWPLTDFSRASHWLLTGHLEAPFWKCFFDPFFEGVFFAPWARFGCPRWPKCSQNVAKIEPKGSLGTPSGKCKNHGRGHVFSTYGSLGEGPGGDFFQTGSPDPFWRGPGEHFSRF